MRGFAALSLAPLLVLTGCAADGASDAPDALDASTAPNSESGVADALDRWDAAVAADDARELTVVALALPWHVVSDCGPNLDRAERDALVGDGEAALAALKTAEEDGDGPLTASAILDAVGAYVESVREGCL